MRVGVRDRVRVRVRVRDVPLREGTLDDLLGL